MVRRLALLRAEDLTARALTAFATPTVLAGKASHMISLGQINAPSFFFFSGHNCVYVCVFCFVFVIMTDITNSLGRMGLGKMHIGETIIIRL